MDIVRVSKKWIAAFAITVALTAAGPAVHAGVISYCTPTGSTTSGGPVSAQADFTFGTDTLTIVLTNLLQNPTSDAQNISGISFTLNGSSSSVSLTSATGATSTISAGGAYTAGVSSNLDHWGVSGTSSVTLTTLTGGKPNQLIIGPDSAGGFDPTLGAYTNANSSIIQHNPVVLGSGTFVLSIAGVSPTQLSDVVFRFGTTGEPITGQNCIPEPSSIVMGAMATVGLGLVGLRRRRRTA